MTGTSPTLQIAIDCADPHLLADFWGAALDVEVEDHHDQIQSIIDGGYATLDDTIERNGRRAWRTAAACRDPRGALPRLLFQQVPEPKTVKDRIHIDLHYGPGERDGVVERMLALGATKLWDGQQGPQTWVTLADPEGNEFCVG
jgi:hypothetical protein